MPQATIVTLADEVTADLNKKAGAWEWSFKAERWFQPKFNFEQTDVLQVGVVPMTCLLAPDSRSEWTHDYTVDAGLLYRADPNKKDQAPDTFDSLLRLVEQITDHYKTQRPVLADCPLVAIGFGGPTGAWYNHAVIETQNQFVSVVSLTFRKWR